jgi:cell division protein FtsL
MKRFALLALTVFMVFAVSPAYAWAVTDYEIEALRQELQDNKDQYDAKKAELEDLQDEFDNLTNRITQLDTDIDEASKELDRAQAAINENMQQTEQRVSGFSKELGDFKAGAGYKSLSGAMIDSKLTNFDIDASASREGATAVQEIIMTKILDPTGFFSSAISAQLAQEKADVYNLYIDVATFAYESLAGPVEEHNRRVQKKLDTVAVLDGLIAEMQNSHDNALDRALIDKIDFSAGMRALTKDIFDYGDMYETEQELLARMRYVIDIYKLTLLSSSGSNASFIQSLEDSFNAIAQLAGGYDPESVDSSVHIEGIDMYVDAMRRMQTDSTDYSDFTHFVNSVPIDPGRDHKYMNGTRVYLWYYDKAANMQSFYSPNRGSQVTYYIERNNSYAYCGRGADGGDVIWDYSGYDENAWLNSIGQSDKGMR